MIPLNMTAMPGDIETYIRGRDAGLDECYQRARARIPYYKREVLRYQWCVLWYLARQYNQPGAKMLEIGTALGYTSAALAEAAPLAVIETLNTSVTELPVATKFLSPYGNVKVKPFASWEYLANYRGDGYDLIFVDGDHKRIALDLPWWKHVRVGGLFCFHDYSPLGTPRQCPPVFEGVTRWAKDVVERPLDVIVFDNTGVGFAGMYKIEHS